MRVEKRLAHILVFIWSIDFRMNRHSRAFLGRLISIMISFQLIASELAVADSDSSNRIVPLKTGLFAQQNSHLSEYQFILGTWQITMEMRNQQGQFEKLPNKATMQAFVHADNQTLQTIFKTADGTFSTDLRTFDESNQNWRIQFLNAKKQRWQEFKSRLVDGKMTTIIERGYSGKEKFDVKTEQFSLSSDQFLSNVFYSFDKGKSWIKVYIMTYNRSKSIQ